MSSTSTASTEFETLLKRLRGGDEDAAWQLVYEYGPHVMAVVRRMINKQIRVRLDSQDLAQNVWKSFFFNIVTMTNVRSRDELVQNLVNMTHHKVIDAYRRQLYCLRNGAIREKSLVDHDHEGERIPSPRGTPSHFAMVRERWERMLSERKPHHREVVRRRIAGQSYESIAASMGISERTARRVVVDLWEEHCHDEA